MPTRRSKYPDSLDEIDQIVLDGDAASTGPLAPTPGAVPVARPGDVFLLGVHHVICGDATDLEMCPTLDGRRRAGSRLILTDEPYNVKISGHVTGGAHREFAMASGEMSDAEFAAFNRSAWMGCALAWLCDGAVFGTFIDWRGYPTYSPRPPGSA